MRIRVIAAAATASYVAARGRHSSTPTVTPHLGSVGKAPLLSALPPWPMDGIDGDCFIHYDDAAPPPPSSSSSLPLTPRRSSPRHYSSPCGEAASVDCFDDGSAFAHPTVATVYSVTAKRPALPSSSLPAAEDMGALLRTMCPSTFDGDAFMGL